MARIGPAVAAVPPAVPSPLLGSVFLDYDLDMSRHVALQFYRHRELAHGLQWLVKLDLTAVHVKTLLVQSLGNVSGSNRAQQLFMFSGTPLKRDGQPVELLGQFLCARLFFGR